MPTAPDVRPPLPGVPRGPIHIPSDTRWPVPRDWVFPRDFAANDPRFNIPKGPPSGKIPGFGGLLAGAAIFIFEKVVERVLEIQQEEIDAELEAQNENIQRKLESRARDKKLRTTVMQRSESPLDPPGSVGHGQATPAGLPLPRSEPGQPDRLPRPSIPRPDIETPGRPDFEPDIPSPRLPQTRPDPAIDLPPGLPGQDPFRRRAPPRPRTKPQELPNPRPRRIKNPFKRRIQDPFRQPVGQPQHFSVRFPQFRPVGDANLFRAPQTKPQTTPRSLTSVDPDLLPFPQAQPRQDPARRCKPCKEDNPEPREKCFKGLYREGPLDTDVDFTEWAEVDCFSGVEL